MKEKWVFGVTNKDYSQIHAYGDKDKVKFAYDKMVESGMRNGLNTNALWMFKYPDDLEEIRKNYPDFDQWLLVNDES